MMFKKKCENISNKYYNIASKFVSSNSIARACFILLVCTLMTSANKSLAKKIFHRVENVIKQLVHTSAVCSSRCEELGKFREHSRSYAYTSIIVNITVFDQSLPIIFKFFHRIFEIFRAVFP